MVKTNKLLILLVILAVLGALWVSVQHDARVQDSRNVEIALDYQDIQYLSYTTGFTTRELLTMAREWGAVSLGVGEKTLLRLSQEGRVTLLTGAELFDNYRLGLETAPWWDDYWINPEAVYILTEDRKIFDSLQEQLVLKLHEKFTASSPADNLYLIEVETNLNYARNLTVGIDRQELQQIVDLGYYLIPRISNINLNTEAALENVYRGFQNIAGSATVIFRGAETAGFPGWQEASARSITEAGYSIGVLEYYPSPSWLNPIAQKAGYPVVYAHSNYRGEQASSVINSAVERRVRLLYLNLYPDLPDKNYLDKYQAYVTEVARGVEKAGFRPGKAEPISAPPVHPILSCLIYLGVVSGGVLLLDNFHTFSSRFKILLVLLGAFSGLAGLFIPGGARQLFFLQMTGFAAALVFPCLAVISQMVNPYFGYNGKSRQPADGEGSNRRVLIKSLVILVKMTLISLAGAVIITGILSVPPLLSGLVIFRGVKLTFLLPLFIIGAAVLLRYWESERKKKMTLKMWVQNINELFQRPLLCGYLLVLAVMGVLLVIYIGRTGHTAGIIVPEIELKLRDLLSQRLVIRPRLKEFLIGHPVTMLALYLALKKENRIWVLLLCIAGATAQLSLVNTFCHLVAPFSVSILRTFHGLWIGAVSGVILVWAFVMIRRVWKRNPDHEKDNNIGLLRFR